MGDGKLQRKSTHNWMFWQLKLLCQDWINGYEYSDMEYRTWLSLYLLVSMTIHFDILCWGMKRFYEGPWWSIQASLHQKLLISLVDLTPKKSLLNSKTIIGLNLEHYQKDEISMDQLKWVMNLLSLADTILKEGNFKITLTEINQIKWCGNRGLEYQERKQ